MRFPIRFGDAYRILSILCGLPPDASYVYVTADRVRVHMGWAFLADVARTSILSASSYDGFVLSRGVHGFAGRWLVNGSGKGIVTIEFAPGVYARVLGFRTSLRELLVSVEDPDGLRAALGR